MRTRNRTRLAAVMVTCSLAATAYASPPSSAQGKAPVAKSQLVARAPTPSSAEPRAAAEPAKAAAAMAPFEMPKTPAERATMLKEAEAKLDTADAEGVEQAFSILAQLGGADAIKIVVARVRRGLPPQLIEPAIAALVAFKQPTVAPILLELTSHRRWQVREKAIDALGSLRAKTAQPSLLYALDDPSAEVRTAAVQALGLVGDARALPALTLAMERNAEGAALTLGKIGSAKELDLLLARARKGEVGSVEAGLHAMLLRVNLPLPLKLKLVNELAKIGSPSTNEVLTVWAQTWSGDPRVLQALNTSTGQSAKTAVPAPVKEPAKAPAKAPQVGAVAAQGGAQ